jgi:hypothetical protein
MVMRWNISHVLKWNDLHSFESEGKTILRVRDGPSGFIFKTRRHLQFVDAKKFQNPIDGNLRMDMKRG